MIPRQLFKVPIQAAVGGGIVARKRFKQFGKVVIPQDAFPAILRLDKG